jgi:hypothetical protein
MVVLMNSFLVKIIIMFFVSTFLLGQTKSNLEVINGLVDSSISIIERSITNNSESFTLKNNSPSEYAGLNSRVITALAKKGVQLNIDSIQDNKINYTISQTMVSYPSLFRDGIFGEYLLERNILISGDYSIESGKKVSAANTFNFEVTDTIKYSNFSFIENSSLPFTKGNVPPSPLFPSIFEPIVAISAVAVTVLLFFSVRSK